MKKLSQKNTHKPQAGTTNPAASEMKVVAMRPAKGKRTNAFAMESIPIKEGSTADAAELSKARQLLAEANDLYGQGEAKAKEAKETAARAASILTKERLQGVISAEVLSATLGDTFGYKDKRKENKDKPIRTPNDPNASATPFGQGEAIRKRIVRLWSANEHVNGRDGGGFFRNLPVDRVKDVLDSFNKGQLGFWAAYEAFAAIKSELNVTVRPAFNVRTIQGIVEDLSGKDAADKLAHNGALFQAYKNLYALMQVLGTEVSAKLPAQDVIAA